MRTGIEEAFSYRASAKAPPLAAGGGPTSRILKLEERREAQHEPVGRSHLNWLALRMCRDTGRADRVPNPAPCSGHALRQSRHQLRSNRPRAPSHGRQSGGSSNGATDSQCTRAGTRRRIEIRHRASTMFSTVAPSQTCGYRGVCQSSGNILDGVLWSFAQDQPIQVTALVDGIQRLSTPLIWYLVVPEVTQRRAEYATTFARCPCLSTARLPVPDRTR
jgi:hypothetical protein